jgi:hypothetical protein
VGLLYSLDEGGRTTARVTFSQFASQLSAASNGPIGYKNPAGSAGVAVYPWVDSNGDGVVQTGEVNTGALIATANGFSTANPTSVTSANQIDPNLKAPITRSVVAGVEREVAHNLSVSAAYTYSRTSNLFDNAAATITPRIGVPLATGYAAGTPLTGTLPDGTSYNVPTFIANSALVTAGGSGFLMTNVPGYYNDYNGLEFGVVKRMSNRWMGRASFGYNNAREHFSSAAGVYDANGNPTRLVFDPLIDGGQFAPQENGGSGSYYLNAKWQVNVDGMYEAPYGIELAANVFGRQGYPFPIYKQVTLGSDTNQQVLVSPKIDTFRFPNVWDTDVRIARQFKYQTLSVRVMADVFNLFNANTALVRINNIGASNFNSLQQNMAPRILRFGVTIGF